MFREAMHNLIQLTYSTQNDTVLQVIGDINEMRVLHNQSLMNCCRFEGHAEVLMQELKDVKETVRGTKAFEVSLLTNKRNCTLRVLVLNLQWQL